LRFYILLYSLFDIISTIIPVIYVIILFSILIFVILLFAVKMIPYIPKGLHL